MLETTFWGLLTQCLKKYYTYYTNLTPVQRCGTDERATFWGQKVRVQGHVE